MGYRAFIVEDDRALADALRMKLSREGHTVEIAKHQREAYQLLDRKAFDFTLLDLRLPTDRNDMDPNVEVGFAILDHIRERFSQDELPVIVMTAYEETSQTAVRALKAFANDYIQKPFEDSPVSLDDKLAGITRYLENIKGEDPGSRKPSSDKRHRIVFKSDCLEINGVRVVGRYRDLLLLLGSRSLMLSPVDSSKDGVAMTGKQIAEALKIEEPTVRQYVRRFRSWIATEYKQHKNGSIGDQDIIRNLRDWKGYELNFETVCITRE